MEEDAPLSGDQALTSFLLHISGVPWPYPDMELPAARDLLGLIALDGMAIALTLLERLARDSSQPSRRVHADLLTARIYRDALAMMSVREPLP